MAIYETPTNAIIPERRSLFADILRTGSAIPGMQERAPNTINLAGFGAAPPRVINNTKGKMWNNIKDIAGGAMGFMAGREEDAQKGAMDAAMQDAITGQITPQKQLALLKMGVPTDFIKSLSPQGEQLGKASMLQYGQSAKGMNTVNALQPGTFSPEQIAQSQADEQAGLDRDYEQKVRIAQASRAPTQGRETFDEWKQKQDYTAKLKGGSPTTSIDENGNVVVSPGGNAPSASTTNVDRKFAQESADLGDKSDDMRTQISHLNKSILAQANPALQDKLAQIAAGNDFNSIAQILRTPNAFKNASMVTGLALQQARALAPVSNTDFDKLLAQYPNALSDPEAGAQFLEQLHRDSVRIGSRHRVNAEYYNLRSDGLLPKGMSVDSFKRRLDKAPKSWSAEDAALWPKMSPSERVETLRQEGGF